MNQSLDVVQESYESDGFEIASYNGDNGFDILQILVGPIALHIYVYDKHTVFIKRSIYTVKELVHCTCHYIPYKCTQKITTKALIKDELYCLNPLLRNNRTGK